MWWCRQRSNLVNLILIQIYAHIADKDENEVEKFYSKIDSMLKLTKQWEVTIIFDCKDWERQSRKSGRGVWIGYLEWMRGKLI